MLPYGAGLARWRLFSDGADVGHAVAEEAGVKFAGIDDLGGDEDAHAGLVRNGGFDHRFDGIFAAAKKAETAAGPVERRY